MLLKMRRSCLYRDCETLLCEGSLPALIIFPLSLPDQRCVVRVTAAAGRHLPGLGAADTGAGTAGTQAAEVSTGATDVSCLLTLPMALLSCYQQEAENPLQLRHRGVCNHRHLARVPILLGIR